MKRKLLLLSVLFALFAVLALSSNASAWSHTGQVTKITILEEGRIYIEVTDSGSTAYSKLIDTYLSEDLKKKILAMALTAQANGTEVTIYIAGTIYGIACH